MKQFAVLLAAVAIMGFASSDAFAQHHHRGGGHHHHGHRGHSHNNSAWSISFGTGYGGFGYSQGFAPYGGYYRPVYRPPVYGGGFYGGGYPVYGGSGFNFSYGSGGWGGYRGCGW